ncbi:MAG TPA: SDR family oxidoreductase [Acidimicrobiales bacterium]|jgi:NAD(P)-dependent dehydrogenase (short-subunit alcohol dehydrogenase family)|nr:SDR family oxidoreductase [Acidimicrobiales bacterium]
MSSSLAGRVAIVTGAGRGIGRAIAIHLGSCGAQVVVSSRTSSELEDVLRAVREVGSDGLAVVADATDRDGAKAPVHAALRVYGQVDVLVNNVGGRVHTNHDPYTCDEDVVEQHLLLNVTSGWWTTREVLPHMRARGHGRIIYIGSGASKRSGAPLAYTAAKHAVVGMTRSLAASTGTDGITVNCLCPGWTNTPHNDFALIGQRWGVSASEARARAESENLQHRVLEPEELTAMVALLASEDGRGITGQVISVDGGYKV